MTSELRPVALMHTHDDEFTEFEEYRNGSGCLTQADKDAGWTETPLYTLEAVRAEQAAELAKFKALAETLAGALDRIARQDMPTHRENGDRWWFNGGEGFAEWATTFAAEALHQYKEARDAS